MRPEPPTTDFFLNPFAVPNHLIYKQVRSIGWRKITRHGNCSPLFSSEHDPQALHEPFSAKRLPAADLCPEVFVYRRVTGASDRHKNDEVLKKNKETNLWQI